MLVRVRTGFVLVRVGTGYVRMGCQVVRCKEAGCYPKITTEMNEAKKKKRERVQEREKETRNRVREGKQERREKKSEKKKTLFHLQHLADPRVRVLMSLECLGKVHALHQRRAGRLLSLLRVVSPSNPTNKECVSNVYSKGHRPPPPY